MWLTFKHDISWLVKLFCKTGNNKTRIKWPVMAKVWFYMEGYKPFWKRKTAAMSNYRPVVISGPSGSGKTTLRKKLLEEFPGFFKFIASYTTRGPRPGEVDDEDYHFVTIKKFDEMVSAGEFLEFTTFSGHSYGTSNATVEEVHAAGKICILDMAVHGVKSIKKTDFNARYFFIQPPSNEVLEERLKGRKTETDESLRERLKLVQEADDYAKEPGTYDHIIVNDKLDEAYKKFKKILLAEYPHLQQKPIEHP